MPRLTFVFPAALSWVLFSVVSASAEQYEATLLPERSLRYQTSYGLFEDDFDAFVRPRYLPRWDGDRFVTHLTNLSAENEAAVGYGRAVTDGWSWSLLGGGGYTADTVYRTGQSVFASGIDPTAGNVRVRSSAEGVPGTRGSASAALGAARDLGPGQLGIGAQARWVAQSEARLERAPGLFTLASPEGSPESGSDAVNDLDTGVLFERSAYRRDPEAQRRNLRAVAMAGYAVRKETGWAWAVDLLGGVEQIQQKDTLDALTTVNTADGSSARAYRTATDIGGIAPLVGGAVTLHRAGRRPLWIDLGGEYGMGAGVDGDRGLTAGSHDVSISTGGIQRTYRLAETRTDIYNGTIGRRVSATAGVRQSMALDALLQLGWGVHASYAKVDDDVDVISVSAIEETLDQAGSGRNSDQTRASAEGQSRERRTASLQTVEATLPVALLIRSATDAALEWRLGSEVRYRNTLERADTAVDSVVLPSGLRVDADNSSAPQRYAGVLIPGGRAREARHVSLNASLRAGVGYWFSPTAKVDAIVTAQPAGEGKLDLDDRSVGISALLAF